MPHTLAARPKRVWPIVTALAAMFIVALMAFRMPAHAQTTPPPQPNTDQIADPSATPPDDDELWVALRDGGVALIRHSLAPGTGDPGTFKLDDCSTQRNLSDEGREQARRVGEAFEENSVIVARVAYSQWCRTRETAELAFPDKGEPEPALNSFFGDRSTAEDQTDAVRELVTNWDGPDTLVLVTHQVNITALTDVFPRSGEIIVLRPQEGDFEVLGRITAE
ncbi:histidine phosphatase family protein [Tepidamorphus sp. 3E244]|uniref:histidine phosphatase family protein n=1 Tax=Tepidamorphus sp. 3E244 TaxID=3385498 RepID=UPI0038FC40B9